MTTTYSVDDSGAAVRELLAAGAASSTPMPHTVADGAIPDVLTAIVPAGYRLADLDLTKYDELRTRPRRVHGTATLHQPVSWLAYVARHAGPGTEIYADVTENRVTAVLDGPLGNDTPAQLRPAWGQHRAVLDLTPSDAWRAWLRVDGEWLTQETMAEHLEARTPDLVEPDAATMLEIAQTIKATTGVKFESRTVLHNGERQLRYVESIDGQAGQRGDLSIPQQITLRLQPWRGADLAVPVTARFRYRIADGRLALGVVLDRITEVKDAAWAALVEELTERLGDDEITAPVLAGQPPTYAG